MPVTPSPQIPNDRRSASPKRENDVMETKGHVVTKTAYNAILRGDDASANLRVKRACEARNLARQLFRIASEEAGHYQKIAHTTKENKDMSNEWRKVFRQAEKLVRAVPLQIENNYE